MARYLMMMSADASCPPAPSSSDVDATSPTAFAMSSALRKSTACASGSNSTDSRASRARTPRVSSSERISDSSAALVTRASSSSSRRRMAPTAPSTAASFAEACVFARSPSTAATSPTASKAGPITAVARAPLPSCFPPPPIALLPPPKAARRALTSAAPESLRMGVPVLARPNSCTALVSPALTLAPATSDRTPPRAHARASTMTAASVAIGLAPARAPSTNIRSWLLTAFSCFRRKATILCTTVRMQRSCSVRSATRASLVTRSRRCNTSTASSWRARAFSMRRCESAISTPAFTPRPTPAAAHSEPAPISNAGNARLMPMPLLGERHSLLSR